MLESSPEITMRVVLEILERMGFLFGQPVAVAELVPPERGLMGSISFAGSGIGGLEVRTSSELGGLLAENVLGCAPGTCGANADVEAMGEFLNVALGHLLTTVAPKTAVFDVTAPDVERDEGDDNWRSFAARPETIALEIEGQPFLVHFEATAIDSLGRKAR